MWPVHAIPECRRPAVPKVCELLASDAELPEILAEVARFAAAVDAGPRLPR